MSAHRTSVRPVWTLGRTAVWTWLRTFHGARCMGLGNVPEHGPVVLASNHQSFLDPMAVGVWPPREVSFMARDTLFDHWAFGPLIRTYNAFPVARDADDPRARIKAFREASRRLKQGAAVVVFPEGRRSWDGGIRPFAPGFLSLARSADAWVVPSAVWGSHRAWPRGGDWRPGPRIFVAYGEPFRVPRTDRRGLDRLADETRRRVTALATSLAQGRDPAAPPAPPPPGRSGRLRPVPHSPLPWPDPSGPTPAGEPAD